MKIISHRGNLNGINPIMENSIDYIEIALQKGFDVEIDIWKIDDILFLGHDIPQYKVDLSWIIKNVKNLWIHCKNINALIYFREKKGSNYCFNFFWHENDTVTITSLGYIWAYPGKQPIKGSIAVMPELYNDEIDLCTAICTDYPLNYI